MEFRTQGDVLWKGVVMFEPGSEAILTVRRGVVAGSIRKGSDVYEIRGLRGGRHILERLNPASFGACSGGVAPPAPKNAARNAEVAIEREAGTTAEIHLMSVYTPEARDAAGGVAQIEALIQAAVDNANAAFTNSQINAHYTLVHAALVNHSDAGDLGVDLDWVRLDSTVAALRNQYGADMVSLIVNNGAGYCGLGYVQRTPSSSFASYAFQVTARNCAVGNLTLAHEHGHNLGMEHDPANGPAPSSASYPWSFGHYVNGVFRTVMSYSTPCSSGCTRSPYFSNPAVSYLGYPTGIIDQRDNARTANSTTPVVEGFRAPAVTTAPSAPTGLNASTLSSSAIRLTWADNSNNESGFKVERSSDGVNFTVVATTAAGVASYDNNSLTANTTYHYRVRATNSAGDSMASNTASATTQQAAPPTAPTGLTANAASSTQINLAWSDTSNVESGFYVERSTDGANFTQIAALGSNATAYSNSGLTPGATYYFRVRAYNAGGASGYSNVASATPPQSDPPAAPASLSGTAVTSGSGKNKTLVGVNVAWTDSANNETAYRLERCKVSGRGRTASCTFGPLVVLGANVSAFSDPASALSGSGTYQYRARAENAAGVSAWTQTQVNVP